MKLFPGTVVPMSLIGKEGKWTFTVHFGDDAEALMIAKNFNSCAEAKTAMRELVKKFNEER
jgi:hypothetical protein